MADQRQARDGIALGRKKRSPRFDAFRTPWETFSREMLKHTVRAGRIVAGVVLLVLGVILSVPLVPGPGIVLVVVGLGFLSHEFEWARRLRDWGQHQVERLTGRRHAD